MAKKRLTAGFIGLLSLLTLGPAALADSPCNAGYRDTTAAERAKMNAIVQTVKSAMPAPPAGWSIGGDDDFSTPQSLCQDFAKVPIDYGFTRYYQNVEGMQQKQKLINDQAAIAAAADQKKQPRLEAIQAKMEKISAQQVAFLQKGDLAGASKFNPEIEKLQAEYQKVADEGNDPQRAEAFAKEMNRDTDMTITVLVNPMAARVPPEAKPMAPPAGGKSAYRWHVDNSSSSNDHALYLFGPWLPRGDGKWTTAARAGVPFEGAHTLYLEVTGDPGRVTETIAKIDFARVTAAMK